MGWSTRGHTWTHVDTRGHMWTHMDTCTPMETTHEDALLALQESSQGTVCLKSSRRSSFPNRSGNLMPPRVG